MQRVALGVIALWLMAALGSHLLPLHPYAIDLPAILAPPGESAWLGRDDLGRPLFDRLLIGARVSLWISLWVVGLSAFIGTSIGMLAGYLGGLTDRSISRLIDIFLAFPGILLAIAMAGVLGPGIDNTVIALTVTGWVGFARLARAQTLSLRWREHLQAAEALGTPPWRQILRHLLPLIMAPLIVEASYGVAGVVVAEAGLSFLGLGIQPPEPSWGSMIRDGVRYMLVAPHLVLMPGLALCLVVLAVNLLGDALRDRLDVSGGTRHLG